MQNEVLKAIAARHSTRAFTSQPLSEEQLDAITGAALCAPSGMNRQPWQIIAVTNSGLLAEMETDLNKAYTESGDTGIIERIKSRGGKFLYNATALIFIAVNQSGGVDAGICVENMAIAAQGIGLGSCIVGLSGKLFDCPKADYWRKTLKFPEGYNFAVSIAVGYKAAEGAPHEKDPGKVTVIC